METATRMSFHFPEGLAAIRDDSGAYHIREDRTPAYSHRFRRTFGFYENIATAVDDKGWFHISTDGEPLHNRRFLWCGNFQNGFCSVLDSSGFYHIDRSGQGIYPTRFSYAGDFRYGAAVVYLGANAFHINPDGIPLYSKVFRYAEPFHKGFAVVQDDKGFFHIDSRGEPVHDLRLMRAEPFYNEYAFCDDAEGRRIRLQANGHYTLIPETLEPISIGELMKLITKGARAGLVIRHGRRHPIPKNSADWGNSILLTEEGKLEARQFGALLKGLSLQTFHSPVPRCRETAQCIMDGARLGETSPIEHQMLGNPGIYFDGTYGHEESMLKDYFGFMEQYLEAGSASGMRNFSSASHDLITEVTLRCRECQISVFVTHDLHAASLMRFTGVKNSNRHDWCDYLEGVCVLIMDEKVSLRRFLPPTLEKTR